MVHSRSLFLRLTTNGGEVSRVFERLQRITPTCVRTCQTTMTFRSVAIFLIVSDVQQAAKSTGPWLQAEASSRTTAACLFEFHHSAKLSG